MAIFTLRSLVKDFGIKAILEDASFSLEPNQKVGLIGTNGSGKSTLLKIIAGLEPYDGGELWQDAAAKVIYLPQQPEVDENKTVLEQVFADCGQQAALVQEYEAVSHKLARSPDNSQALMAKLSQLSHQMDATGAWEIETQAKIILTKLGIEDFDAKLGTLSGGYRKRVALATALLSNPDALLMDEPTNHLDAESVEWLQEYLNRYRGAVLLITHDRYFLDRVTNSIIELDRGVLSAYSGNYSYFLEQKAIAEESEASSQRKHRGVLRRELEWLKRGPKARSTKQKARIDRIHDMQDREFRTQQGKVEISTVGRRIGKKVIELTAVGKSFGGRSLIHDFTYEFSPEDRVGIIGPNGAGKSTLMNLITGRLEPDSGQVELGSTVHVGYFDQHSEDLDANPKQRVIDYLKQTAELVKTNDGSVITASQMLERFLFTPNQQYSPLENLSGGERRRLFLLQVLLKAPNVLILDEPTNDLDVQTLSVLEEYLEDFNGTVLVVSHDRYFLDRVVDKIFALEPGGQVRQYPGNYSIYLDIKQAEAVEAKAEQALKAPPTTPSAKASAQDSAKDSAKPRKMSFKEKRELEQLESKIPEMEAKKVTLETTLYNNPPGGYSELNAMTEELAQLETAIATSTERWLELAELAS
jgi:ABC transport system ATP-binding/permease protein